ncbi:MAG: hypothetical protein PHR25_00235 [Clostridia bacterium]|nr:hypothetical protein [Clostridia bacterium]
MINMIIPFIWYQKIQLTAQKYIYVVQKYGYLTSEEKLKLEKDLEERGIEKEKVNINVPMEKQEYGELIELEIRYEHEQKLPTFNGSFKMKTKLIPINIKKVVVSKSQ